MAEESHKSNVLKLSGSQPDLSGQPSADEWWVLKDDNRFGPYTYLEIVRLLQKNIKASSEVVLSGHAAQSSALNDWDYVWTNRLTEWKRVSTLPEFQPDVIKGLRKELSRKLGNQVNEVFFRRRFARAGFTQTLLVHDNQKVMRATSLEIGAGGLALKLNEGFLGIGAKVMVHLRPSPDVPAFNAECEVMSRRVTNASDPMSPVVYGLKFLQVDGQVAVDIDGWAKRKAEMNDLAQLELKAATAAMTAFPPPPSQTAPPLVQTSWNQAQANAKKVA